MQHVFKITVVVVKRRIDRPVWTCILRSAVREPVCVCVHGAQDLQTRGRYYILCVLCVCVCIDGEAALMPRRVVSLS